MLKMALSVMLLGENAKKRVKITGLITTELSVETKYP
jgi:hypothetical protein